MSGRKTTMWERGLSLLLAVVMTVSGTGLTAFATDVIPDEPDTSVTEEIQDTAEPAESPVKRPRMSLWLSPPMSLWLSLRRNSLR